MKQASLLASLALRIICEMTNRLPFHNYTPVQMNQGESQREGHSDENTMIIALLTIPFAILTIAVAIVPLVIGMKYQREYEALSAATQRDEATKQSVDTPQLELAA